MPAYIGWPRGGSRGGANGTRSAIFLFCLLITIAPSELGAVSEPHTTFAQMRKATSRSLNAPNPLMVASCGR